MRPSGAFVLELLRTLREFMSAVRRAILILFGPLVYKILFIEGGFSVLILPGSSKVEHQRPDHVEKCISEAPHRRRRVRRNMACKVPGRL